MFWPYCPNTQRDQSKILKTIEGSVSWTHYFNFFVTICITDLLSSLLIINWYGTAWLSKGQQNCWPSIYSQIFSQQICLRKVKKKLYACFIDFRKGFDSVRQKGLFRKVENLGKNGNFLDLIKDIYCKTKSAVKIGNNTTNFFPYSKGVQQGNPLSPLLFNIFINDIFQKIKN